MKTFMQGIAWSVMGLILLPACAPSLQSECDKFLAVQAQIADSRSNLNSGLDQSIYTALMNNASKAANQYQSLEFQNEELASVSKKFLDAEIAATNFYQLNVALADASVPAPDAPAAAQATYQQQVEQVEAAVIDTLETDEAAEAAFLAACQ